MLHFGKRLLKALIKPPICLQWIESWLKKKKKKNSSFILLLFFPPYSFFFFFFFTLDNINQKWTETSRKRYHPWHQPQSDCFVRSNGVGNYSESKQQQNHNLFAGKVCSSGLCENWRINWVKVKKKLQTLV